jgi:hypothetical protein
MTRHAKSPGIVDDDEVGPTFFGEFGRNASSRTRADDRTPLRDLGPKPTEDVVSTENHVAFLAARRWMWRRRVRCSIVHQFEQLFRSSFGEYRIVDVSVEIDYRYIGAQVRLQPVKQSLIGLGPPELATEAVKLGYTAKGQ